MDTQDRKAILEAAVAAPSADNSQPWLFHWVEDALDLWIDDKRAGRDSDASFLLSDLATGTCLENIAIQAEALGFLANIELFPEPEEQPRWVAHITWTRAECADPGRAQAIALRRTDRSFPWRGISEDSRHRLYSQLEGDGGARLMALDTEGMRRRAHGIMTRAEGVRFASRTLHAEMFRSICFEVGWQSDSEEGLAPGALAVERPLHPLFKALRQWPLMRALNLLGAASLLGIRAAWLPAVSAPLLFVLTVDSLARAERVEAGRLLERFWLAVTAEGLSLQPFAAIGAIAYGGAELEPRWLSMRSVLRSRIEALCGNRHGLVFLRVGTARSTSVSPRSARRALSDFVAG